jgi:hypothetical protein
VLIVYFHKLQRPSVVSYLDLPDLACCLRVCHLLRVLAVDPVLHHYRIRVVAPSRVAHSLFGQSPPRPTVGELVARGVMRGLGIERRWRAGLYFYTSLVSRPSFRVASQPQLRAAAPVHPHLILSYLG